MKKKIFVIGSYWAWNIWDEAILESIHNNLWKEFEIIPAIPHLPYSIFKIPFRLKTIFNLWTSDVVLLWWWWLFTDSDTIKAIKIWWNCINWAKLFNKKIFVYANSIWSFNTEEARNLAKKYLSKADKITVRDEISLKELEKMWLKWEVYSDPVFALNCHSVLDTESKSLNNTCAGSSLQTWTEIFRSRSETWSSTKVETLQCNVSTEHNKIIAVSLRNFLFNHNLFNEYLKNKEKEWFKILFISMTPEDSFIYEKNYFLENRTIVLPKDFHELLKILSKCEMCIWMRLHFLIASALSWKKMLAISYSNKVQWVMDNIWINCVGLNFEGFDKADNLFKSPINLEKERETVCKLNEIFKNFISE